MQNIIRKKKQSQKATGEKIQNEKIYYNQGDWILLIKYQGLQKQRIFLFGPHRCA